MKLLTVKLTRTLTTGAAIATLLMSALPVVAQTSTSKTTNTPASPAAFGVIKGRVVNESGQPLANTTVTAARFNSLRPDQSVTTDREGKFEFTGLEPVTYRLFARLPAYTPLLLDPDEEETRYRNGDTVTLVLVKGGVITGTITNAAGEPVVGIRVRALMTRDAERLPWPYNAIPNERFTDDRGVYRIYGLPTATYVVSAGGAAEQSWRPDPFEGDSPIYAPDSTRDTADEINVRAGEENNNVNIVYRSEPGRSISGTASGPNTSELRGFGVKLSLVKDNGATGYTTGQQPGTNGFVFRGLADGDYDIRAFSATASGDFMWSESKRIRVNGADVTGIHLVPHPLSSVSGKVVLQESKVTACTDKQRPVFSEMLLSARPKVSIRKFEVPYSISGSPINPDTEGNVSFNNLLPGQYYFGVQFTGSSWYLDSISLPAVTTTDTKNVQPAKPGDAAKTWTTLKSGERLQGLTVTLTHGAASVLGEVAAKEGENLSVYLVPAERERADDVLRFFTAVAGADGKFEMNSVAPGRYLVLVTSEVVALNKLRSPDAAELRSKLRREAEAAKTELELKPCQNVTDFRLKL